MKASSSLRSMRHTPRPPIFTPGKSPLRSRAYTWVGETDSSSATAGRVMNRVSPVVMHGTVARLSGAGFWLSTGPGVGERGASLRDRALFVAALLTEPPSQASGFRPCG